MRNFQRNIAEFRYPMKKERKNNESKHIKVHFKHGYKISVSKIVAVKRLLAVYSGNAFSFSGRKLCQGKNSSHTHLLEVHSSI